MPPQVTISGKSIDLLTYTGTAAGVGGYAVTEVSGGGRDAVSVSSTTSVHKEFHIQLLSGQEKPIHLTNEPFSVRNGNVVSAVLAVPLGQDSGRYIALRNHTTGQVMTIDDGLKTATSIMGLSPLALPAALIGLIPIPIALFNGYYITALIFAVLVPGCARHAWTWHRERKALGQAAVNAIQKATAVQTLGTAPGE